MTINSSDFFGPNAGYLTELYERYQNDAASVDAQTRQAFDNGLRPPSPPLSAPFAGASDAPPSTNYNYVSKIVAGARLGRIVRELGHLDAHLDPLGSDAPSDPALRLQTHGITDDELAALPAQVIGGPLSETAPNASVALAKLRGAYSGFIGYEDDHIQIAEERDWLRNAVETGRFFDNFGPTEKKALLERLTEVDGF